MNDWITKNAVSITMTMVTIVSTYAVLGYRVAALEARQDRQGTAISALQTTQSEQNVAIQIALAKLQTDVGYIKDQIYKINH